MDRDWPRVGRAIRERRQAKGWTQHDIAQRGGPSTAQQRMLEKERYGAEMHLSGVSTYEAALEWRAGSFESLHRGGEPYPIGERVVDAPTAAQRLEDVQAHNRQFEAREARHEVSLMIRWLATRQQLTDLETEYANYAGITLTEAQRALSTVETLVQSQAGDQSNLIETLQGKVEANELIGEDRPQAASTDR